MNTETESSTNPIEETRPSEIAPVPNIASDVPAVVQEQSRLEPRRSLRVPRPHRKIKRMERVTRIGITIRSSGTADIHQNTGL
jgi:hypothetical protein